MKHRRAILVDDPSIGNQEAIARLATLAGSVDVTVLVTPGDLPSLQATAALELGDILLREKQQHADAIVEELAKHGIQASSTVRVGPRSIEVIREVLETQPDFVIKVSAGSKRSTLGDMDPHLLRQCPCPVWITRPRERSPYKRVFAAVDPQKGVPGRDADLDDRILQWAIEICRADQAELVIVHAWDMKGDGLMLREWGQVPDAEAKKLVAEMRTDRERRLEQLLENQDLSAVEHTVQIEIGAPSEVIPAALDRGRADLLVMGTVARTGLSGFFIGNTAEQIMPQVGCAIFAVKPEGFTTSVRVT